MFAQELSDLLPLYQFCFDAYSQYFRLLLLELFYERNFHSRQIQDHFLISFYGFHIYFCRLICLTTYGFSCIKCDALLRLSP